MNSAPPNPSGAGPADEAAPLAGCHAVVTGAGRGIGRTISETLARLGADLTLLGRNLERLAGAAASIGAVSGSTPRTFAGDVADADAIAVAFARAHEAAGPVAILINNAGISGSAPFTRTGAALWQSMLETNLTGTFRCTQLVYPAMVEAGWGRIVNIASTSGLKGYAYTAAYCASKHGVVGLTRALALEAARTGVTVNAVCPGFTETGMVADTLANIVEKTGRTEEQARAELTALNPQGRLVDPQEVADAVAWLCLPSSGAITGQAIAVAGGEVM